MLPVRQQQLGASDTHTVLVVGSLGCGKTALVSRLTNGKHVQQYRPTLGCELSEKEVRPVRRADGLTEGEPGTFGDSGEQSVYYELDHGASLGTVELWDCGGHERFRPLIQQLYRHAQGALLVYDMTDERSFQELSYWHGEMLRACPEAKLMLVGTKHDLQDQLKLTTQDNSLQARTWKLPHVTVSAKTGEDTTHVLGRLLALMDRTRSES